MTGLSLSAELARMTAYFQLRTIATHIGADPNAADPQSLTLSITQPCFEHSEPYCLLCGGMPEGGR